MTWRADPLFAGDGYVLLDTHRVGRDDLRRDNAAALLAELMLSGSVVSVEITPGAVVIGNNANLRAELRTEMRELRE